MALIAAAAFTLFACTREEAPESRVPSDEPITLKFNIKNADKAAVSKAILGTTTIQGNTYNFLDWEDGDHIGTFSVGSFANSETASNNNPGGVVVNGSGESTLNVQVFKAGDITNIYSYFPYSASAGKDKTAAIVSIPESQTMNNSVFDADAMPMAGEPKTIAINDVVANTDTPCGVIRFSNLGAIINFKVYSSAATDETITSVKYVTEGNIGGAFTIDLTAVDFSNDATLALTASNPVSVITTSYASHPTIPTGKANAIDVFMVVAPGTYANTQVVVTTNAYKYTLNASNAKTFARSHVKPMNIDIQAGVKSALDPVETWTKVTDANDFTAGTYYILRGDGSYYLPNAKTTTNTHPACVAFTPGSVITNSMRWTATASGDGLIFESVADAGYYLWTTSTGSANTICVLDSSSGANASNVWEFSTLVVDERTYYTASAGASKYLASYGTSNWRYYGSSNISNDVNIPAEFYKLSVNDTRDEAGIAWKKGGAPASTDTASLEDGGNNTLPTITLDNPNSLTVSYSSSDTDVATINSSTGVVSLVSAGETTISAIFAGDVDYKPSTVTYTLTVSDNRTPSHAFETIAELNTLASALSNNETATYSGALTSAVISYVPDSGNAIIKDASGSILVFKGSHGFLQGQTFTGELEVTVKKYYTTIELTAIDATFTGSETEVLPATMTLAELEGNFSTYQNAYVKVTNLTVDSRDGKNVSNGGKTYLVYDNAGSSSAGAGDVITVVGTVADHNGTNQIKVWASANITVTALAPKAVTYTQPTGAAAAAGCAIEVSVGGSPIASGTTVASGTSVSLRATVGSGYEFAGWTVNGASVANASAATTTFTMGESAVSISASFNSESGTSYTKVTSAPANWSGTYIIVYEESTTSGLVCLAGTDEYQNWTSATISNGVITSNDLSSYEVEIASYSTGYSIKALGGANTNKYLEGKGSSSNGTSFAASPSKVTTFGISDGAVTITNNTNLFVYNSTSGVNGERWRFYKSGTAAGASYKKPALYKKN